MVELARLRCRERRPDGSRCEARAAPGTRRCGNHQPPAERLRCRHRFDDGTRCVASIAAPERGNDFCMPHKRPCPGPPGGDPCGRKLGKAATPRCRSCEKHRKQALVCGYETDTDGSRCAVVVAADGDRCHRHRAEHLPADERRCQRRYPSGQRCHRARSAGCETCLHHTRACPDCGRGTGRAEGPCTRCAPNCAQPGCRRAAERGAEHCHFHGRVKCSEMSASTGRPCQMFAGPNGRCRHHADLPADERRCVVRYEHGTRCPNPRQDRSAEGACRRHQHRYDLLGHAPQPTMFEDERRCGVLTGADPGSPCRQPVLHDGRCRHHRAEPIDAERCSHRYPDGQQCAARSLAATGHGTGQVCQTHQVACQQCGALTADADRRLCRTHRPRCDAISAKTGSRCQRPAAAGAARCANHLRLPADGDRCQHRYATGEQCASLRHGREDLTNDTAWVAYCPTHARRCQGTDGPQRCEVRTRLPDELCRAHRPRCAAISTDGDPCGLAAVADGLCPIHWRREHQGQCALRGHDGQPCRWPAAHPTPEGKVCSHHQRLLALGDELRCTHRFPTGERCPARRLETSAKAAFGRHSWAERSHYATCGTHWRAAPSCEALTVEGEPCQNGALHLHDGTYAPTCAAHAPVPDDEQCQVEVADGVRCPGQRHEGRLVCVYHYDQQPRCQHETHRGGPCGATTLADLDVCAQHAKVAVAANRCAARDGDQQCARRRVPRRRYCLDHLDQQPICGVSRRTDGQPCPRLTHEHLTSCLYHRPPRRAEHRCVFADDAGQCPHPRLRRRRYCIEHAPQQPRCAARPRGVRCPHLAVGEHPTCDRHDGWTPDTPDDDPEAYERFFVRPHAELIYELVMDAFRPTATLRVSSDQMGERQLMGDDLVIDYDPYDLTGAQRAYREFVADGVPVDEAREMARQGAQSMARSSVERLTHTLRPYLVWCQDHHRPPLPAEQATIARFLGWLSERGRLIDGKPLQGSYYEAFATAISKAHTVAGHPDPFERWPFLRRMVQGYVKTHSRPQLQAHAIRIDELAELIAATHRDSDAQLRDMALLTTVFDPESDLNIKQATRLEWSGVQFGADDDPSSPTRLLIPRPSGKGFDEVAVPNRYAETLGASPSGEVPLSARLCGTDALRAMAKAHLRTFGEAPSGKVFRADGRDSITPQAIRKVIKQSCEKAGTAYASTLTFDQRAAVLEALAEPALIALRDAAVMATMWWGSLRRSEAAALDVGDIGYDSRGRGLVLQVRRGKTHQDQAEFVPVPYAVVKGRRLPADLGAVLHRYLDAYTRWWQRQNPTNAGKPLPEDAPLFISLRSNQEVAEGGRVSAQGIHRRFQAWAEKADIKAELGERVSSHGLRAGYATESLAGGMPREEVARRQRRKTAESLTGYFRLADQFESSLAFLTDQFDDDAFDLERVLIEGEQRNVAPQHRPEPR